jgi:hypothetical protein
MWHLAPATAEASKAGLGHDKREWGASLAYPTPRF